MGISEWNAASARKPVMNQGRRSGMRRAAVAAPLRLIHQATSISIGASSATRVSLTIVATSPAFCEKEKRSEGRRVGHEGVNSCSYRWAPYPYQQKQKKQKHL